MNVLNELGYCIIAVIVTAALMRSIETLCEYATRIAGWIDRRRKS